MLTVYDTGLASAAYHQALDRLSLARAGEGAGAILRFYRSLPAVSVGRHQALARELRIEYCERHGIDIVRRPSGGGALYVDPGQLGFTLTLNESAGSGALPLAAALSRGAEAVAAAARQLGANAYAKPPNDVEVGGRKIASVFAAREGRTLLLQGLIVLRADVRSMLEALRVPTEKLSADGLAAARERLTDLGECLGTVPAPRAVRSALAECLGAAVGARPERRARRAPAFPVEPRVIADERAIARRLAWDADTGEIETVTKTRFATLRARARFDVRGGMLPQIEFATDAHLAPAGFLADLQDALAGSPLRRAPDIIAQLARARGLDAVGFGCGDLARAVAELGDKHRLVQRHGFAAQEVNALFSHCPGRAPDLAATLAAAQVLLVPYCAKPGWCKWRRRDGCSECGECEVGDAYRLARERGLAVTTITHYEHLVATLRELKARNVAAYVGMCCASFFLKRHRAFADAGIPAVLMDVSGANCYELKQEHEGYAGRFQPQAKIDRGLLERVARLMPGAGAAPDAAR